MVIRISRCGFGLRVFGRRIALAEQDALYASLQYRAFRGELSIQHKQLMDSFKPIGYSNFINRPIKDYYADFADAGGNGS